IHDGTVALPVLIHGDASFAAQGVVAETFNLARLKGYTTGGTIHLIGNNQLGFTTDPKEGRSTDYSSDLAKGFDAPIIHVNADDADPATAQGAAARGGSGRRAATNLRCANRPIRARHHRVRPAAHNAERATTARARGLHHQSQAPEAAGAAPPRPHRGADRVG